MHHEDRPLLLKDCVAIVTGASRGAGRGIAIELGAAGAIVRPCAARAGPPRPAGEQRLGRARDLQRRVRRALLGTPDGALGRDVRPRRAQSPAGQPPCRADHGAPAARPALARTESPRYLGRAVAALAGDPAVLQKSGVVHRVADLAREYGFTDIDGRQVEAFELEGG